MNISKVRLIFMLSSLVLALIILPNRGWARGVSGDFNRHEMSLKDTESNFKKQHQKLQPVSQPESESNMEDDTNSILTYNAPQVPLSIYADVFYIDTDILTKAANKSIQNYPYPLIELDKDESGNGIEVGVRYNLDDFEFMSMTPFVEGAVYYFQVSEVRETFDLGNAFKKSGKRDAFGIGGNAGFGLSAPRFHGKNFGLNAVIGFKLGKNTVEFESKTMFNDIVFESFDDDTSHTGVFPYGKVSIVYYGIEGWNFELGIGASKIEVEDPIQDIKLSDTEIEAFFRVVLC